MADVVMQLGAERLDLRLTLVYLIRAYAQLEEGAREVEYQEHRGVPHESQAGQGHKNCSRPERGLVPRGCLDGRHVHHPFPIQYGYGFLSDNPVAHMRHQPCAAHVQGLKLEVSDAVQETFASSKDERGGVEAQLID